MSALYYVNIWLICNDIEEEEEFGQPLLSSASSEKVDSAVKEALSNSFSPGYQGISSNFENGKAEEGTSSQSKPEFLSIQQSAPTQ